MAKKQLDYLAEQACAVLDASCGKAYADEKRARLTGVDRFGVIVWLNELDKENLSALAERLNVDFHDLDILRRTARQL